MIKVTKVKPLAGFQLDVTFNDGSRGTADLSKDLIGPLKAVRAPQVWSGVRVEHGAIVWSDDLDLAAEFVYARAHNLKPPRTGKDVAENQAEVTMRELRAFAGKSQEAVAEAMGVAQGEVSRLERRDDTRLSTLENYVKALGGELEVFARFGNKSMKVTLG